MKSRGLFTLLFMTVVSINQSCKQDCEIRIQQLYNTEVFFEGYNLSELDTIIRKRYQSANDFSALESIDTITCDSIVMLYDGTTICRDSIYKPFMKLHRDTAYRIILPQSGDSFSISDADYNNETTVRWRQKHCDYPGTTLIEGIKSININDIIVPVGEISMHRPAIILKRN